MSTNQRIERAILTALVNNMAAAGFRAVAVYTQEDYQRATDCGADGFKLSEVIGTELERAYRYMTAAEVSAVFDAIDMSTPTIHFTRQHETTWGSRGVMVVPGNGVDFISDWHSPREGVKSDLVAFDAIVMSVADAASEGALTLIVG